MVNQEVLETLRTLEGGETVLIHPNTDKVYTSQFQPEEPFETEVKWVKKTQNEDDHYWDEDGLVDRLHSTEHEIIFYPHPDDDSKAEEYVTRYKKFMDGHESGGRVLPRHYFRDKGQRYSAEGAGFDIEKIEIIEE